MPSGDMDGLKKATCRARGPACPTDPREREGTATLQKFQTLGILDTPPGQHQSTTCGEISLVSMMRRDEREIKITHDLHSFTRWVYLCIRLDDATSKIV
jgi:hypothetical protein